MDSKTHLLDLSIHPLLLQFLTCCTFLIISSSASFSLPRGIHPLDEKYYSLEVISCKDGSNSFTRDRLNDDFCDCPDGTDEPGTSACPAGKFYCQNLGSKPQFVHSSRINDRICDCCDGSDEYDGAISCPNTCVMGGNVHYKTIPHISRNKDSGSILAKENSKRVEFDDLLQKVKGLKMVIILQLVVIGCVVLFRIYRRRVRSKRSHHC